jgi:hypothetical protein
MNTYIKYISLYADYFLLYQHPQVLMNDFYSILENCQKINSEVRIAHSREEECVKLALTQDW